MNAFLLLLRRMDKYLLGASLLLTAVGFLMIYSTTFSGDSGSGLLVRQFIFFGLGLAALSVFASLDYRYLRRQILPIYVFGILLLIGVLIFGFDIRGSTRWYDLGFFQFQPVEYMKLALIIALATFFQRRLFEMSRFKNIVLSGLLTAVPIALVLMQTDLGSAAVLGAIWLGMLLGAGVSRKHLLILLILFVVISFVSWQFVLEDYQKNRVHTFLDPDSDPQGRGYNALQAIIAVGSGGITGQGFARGIVSQLRFLPERQTDFIFASLAEELGFLGTALFLVLMLFWFYRIINVIRQSRENFGFFLGLGIFCYLFFQTAINVAMNLGLVPITGLPLPLVSYGGSSLIISLAAIGILQSIMLKSQAVRFD